MDFARSVAHLSILNPGAPTGCRDNTLGGSDVVSLYTTGYISNLGKKCPLCAFNATGGQITVKSIQGLYEIPSDILSVYSTKYCTKAAERLKRLHEFSHGRYNVTFKLRLIANS